MASSASSFQRSSRYSTSTVRSFNTDSLHPRLHSEFGEETSISSITNGFEPESFSRCHGDVQDESPWAESFGGYQGDRESFGGYHGDQQYHTPQGGNQGDWTLGDEVQARGSGVSAVRARGNRYFLSADVSGFEPHEVVVVAYNQRVVIHAEKIGADGSVGGKFTHKSVLPADMNPLSVSSELTAEKMLIISIERIRDPGRPASNSPLTSDLL
ncbi:heat shock protein beta-7 [Rhinichthys klamathensis goyatoka]|uniref:heat shock protein beta-7 n=1 Tax=Rhinichthys klamathensis goyatoka TaxID=3034132 RepID=UPI0024B61FBE|nr:heat shock protein beta-7 [Rhinichthys klamathensis goyatoka]